MGSGSGSLPSLDDACRLNERRNYLLIGDACVEYVATRNTRRKNLYQCGSEDGDHVCRAVMHHLWSRKLPGAGGAPTWSLLWDARPILEVG